MHLSRAEVYGVALLAAEGIAHGKHAGLGLEGYASTKAIRKILSKLAQRAVFHISCIHKYLKKGVFGEQKAKFGGKHIKSGYKDTFFIEPSKQFIAPNSI